RRTGRRRRARSSARRNTALGSGRPPPEQAATASTEAQPCYTSLLAAGTRLPLVGAELAQRVLLEAGVDHLAEIDRVAHGAGALVIGRVIADRLERQRAVGVQVRRAHAVVGRGVFDRRVGGQRLDDRLAALPLRAEGVVVVAHAA